MSVQMPQLAQTLPRAYADSCNRVGPDTERSADTEVSQESLVSEALTCAPYDAGKLGFAGAERDAGLGG